MMTLEEIRRFHPPLAHHDDKYLSALREDAYEMARIILGLYRAEVRRGSNSRSDGFLPEADELG